MKLYTEEQVKEALKSGYLNFFDDTNRLNLFAQEYISKLTPIELPTWDDVEKAIEFGWNLSHYHRLDTEENLLKRQHNFIIELKQEKK